MKGVPAKSIGGMKPWLCSYKGDNGLTFGNTIYGTDPDQIEADHADRFRDLSVDGELLASFPVSAGKERAIRRQERQGERTT
ncbi:MAG: hypothetical protein AB3N21_15875 [Ruegeria sp.]|uniref:hypothetical protein n=1 Tax=Ruegeria sp. TaxID=1879320 RepID=UPI00349E761F